MMALEDHRAMRLAALQAEDGWLNLVARVDIAPGDQTVGRAGDIVLPSGPKLLGRLRLTPLGAVFRAHHAAPDAPDQAFLAAPDGLPQLRMPPFLLEIHTVDGQPALRVRDLTLPRQVQLRYFPVRSDWVIHAAWQELESPVSHRIGQKGAAETSVPVTHVARFSWAGHAVALLATHWKAGKPMFVIRDATASADSYAAARFLIGEDAGRGGITLDFNRAFNPPCAFTDLAICPLPPRDNVLPFRIEAGELAP